MTALASTLVARVLAPSAERARALLVAAWELARPELLRQAPRGSPGLGDLSYPARASSMPSRITKSATFASPSPFFRLVKTNGLSPRMLAWRRGP